MQDKCNIISKGCDCSSPCGCGDHVLSTPPCASNPQACEVPTQCSETFSSGCVLYTGDDIANLDIKKGDSLTKVIQTLLMAVINPGCIFPNSPCKGVVNVGSYVITTTTIKMAWDAVDTATGYQVQYRLPTAANWTLNPTVTTLTDTIGGLTSATAYYVRVLTICGANSCYSPVLIITTKT